ncbi:MAG: ATP-binding protein [Romboutsia sp.]
MNLDNLNYTVLSYKKWLLFIFGQLIGNALKYTDSNDSISIRSQVLSNYIFVKINDTRCGIKEEDLNRIFDKCFTGNNGRNNAKSTSLSLYLVKELCSNLNHTIEVNSSYGEYSEFVIKLNIVNL